MDLPSFALGAIAALGLVLLISLLRRDMDPTRTSGNAIASSRRFPMPQRPSAPASPSRPGPSRPVTMGTPSQRVSDLLRQGRKIEAIKAYREQTGAGLREAKDAVEALEIRQGRGRP